MVCIYCKSKTRVANSRSQKRSNGVWRRRVCLDCGAVFTSIEEVDLAGSLVVRRKSNVEPFSRDILLLSIYDSLKHRKAAIKDAEGLTQTVIARLYSLVANAEVQRSDIVETCSVVLHRFDKVAATHYVAFHPAIAKSLKPKA